jgi:hypothetical protein
VRIEEELPIQAGHVNVGCDDGTECNKMAHQKRMLSRELAGPGELPCQLGSTSSGAVIDPAEA